METNQPFLQGNLICLVWNDLTPEKLKETFLHSELVLKTGLKSLTSVTKSPRWKASDRLRSLVSTDEVPCDSINSNE